MNLCTVFIPQLNANLLHVSYRPNNRTFRFSKMSTKFEITGSLSNIQPTKSTKHQWKSILLFYALLPHLILFLHYTQFKLPNFQFSRQYPRRCYRQTEYIRKLSIFELSIQKIRTIVSGLSTAICSPQAYTLETHSPFLATAVLNVRLRIISKHVCYLYSTFSARTTSCWYLFLISYTQWVGVL